jgi:hypothetical protein
MKIKRKILAATLFTLALLIPLAGLILTTAYALTGWHLGPYVYDEAALYLVLIAIFGILMVTAGILTIDA